MRPPTRPAATHEELTAQALSEVTGTDWIPLLLVLLFGTIVATAEYERGAVQMTFTVAPRRASVVLAKATLVAAWSSSRRSCPRWRRTSSPPRCSAGTNPRPSVTPASLRVIVGVALYAAAAGVIAMCFGFLTRSSIGAVAATLGFLYAVPALLQAVPVEAVGWFARTIPGPASTPLELPGPPRGRPDVHDRR